MANFTPNYNLRKPVGTEQFDIDRDFNANWDVIDGELKERESEITALGVSKADKLNTYTKTEVDTKDGLLVPKTTTVNGKALSANVSVTATDVPNTPAGGVSATTVQGAINELDAEKANKTTTYSKTEVDTKDATKADKLMATNLVPNGDFSQGATGWFGTDSTTFTVSNGEAKFTPTKSFAGIEVRGIQFLTGHTYYMQSNIKTTDPKAKFYIYGVNSSNVPSSEHSGSGNYEAINLYLKINTITPVDGKTNLKIQSASSSNFVEISTTGLCVIDLTATFGSGNEPNREQMSRMLSEFTNSNFDGSREILPPKLLISIGALQPPTTSPTLLNGRSGDLSYDYTNGGLIILKGSASGGTLNTNIIVLRPGHRPTSVRQFPIIANGALGIVEITPSGEVRQTSGSTTSVSFDGIVFKAVQ